MWTRERQFYRAFHCKLEKPQTDSYRKYCTTHLESDTRELQDTIALRQNFQAPLLISMPYLESYSCLLIEGSKPIAKYENWTSLIYFLTPFCISYFGPFKLRFAVAVAHIRRGGSSHKYMVLGRCASHRTKNVKMLEGRQEFGSKPKKKVDGKKELTLWVRSKEIQRQAIVYCYFWSQLRASAICRIGQ